MSLLAIYQGDWQNGRGQGWSSETLRAKCGKPPVGAISGYGA